MCPEGGAREQVIEALNSKGFISFGTWMCSVNLRTFCPLEFHIAASVLNHLVMVGKLKVGLKKLETEFLLLETWIFMDILPLVFHIPCHRPVLAENFDLMLAVGKKSGQRVTNTVYSSPLGTMNIYSKPNIRSIVELSLFGPKCLTAQWSDTSVLRPCCCQDKTSHSTNYSK